jgi:hypothetical protein
MQLDFFNDSHQVALRNDVIDALASNHAVQLEDSIERLGSHYPHDFCLAPAQILLDWMQHTSTVPFNAHQALADVQVRVQTVITPAALRVMGAERGTAWLQAVWRALAVRTQALPYHPDWPQAHAAPCWLGAGEWHTAQQVVARIPAWRKIPNPLQWMLVARLEGEAGLDGSWDLLAECAWLSPARCKSVIAQSKHSVLGVLQRAFVHTYEGTGTDQDWAWFPAWVLIERPSLASSLTLAQAGQHTPAEQAMRCLLQILGYERQGLHQKVVQCRETLRGLNAELFALYLKTR